MEQPFEPIIGAIERAADQGRDVGRSQETVSGKLAHDVHVVVREAKSWGLRRTAEAGAAGQCDR
jgi:hypothetical protein